jgi:hypothetical protein
MPPRWRNGWRRRRTGRGAGGVSRIWRDGARFARSGDDGRSGGSIETVSALLPRVDALHAELAARHGMHILAASAPRKDADGRFRNTARLFAPNGRMGAGQAGDDPLEREEWGSRRARGSSCSRPCLQDCGKHLL